MPSITGPLVGVAVFVLRPDAHFIFGQRKGSHGSGTYALPGGRLEPGESFEACAAREVREETGLEIEAEEVAFLTAVNSVFEGLHWVTIFMGARVTGEVEPRVTEPDKCEGWRWVTWEEVYREGNGAVMELFTPMWDLVRQRVGFRADSVLARALEKGQL